MQSLTDYDNVTEAVREFFVGIAAEADRHGVEDWILDLGFGFAKTVEQNWQLLREMELTHCLPHRSPTSSPYKTVRTSSASMMSPRLSAPSNSTVCLMESIIDMTYFGLNAHE